MSNNIDFKSKYRIENTKAKNAENTENTGNSELTPLEFRKSFEGNIPDLIDMYYAKNTDEIQEYMCNLVASIFMVYKKMYPDFSIFIPFRVKSMDSFIQNIDKEITNQIPNDVSSSFDFDNFEVSKDIDALTIVLNNINRTIPRNKDYRTIEINDMIKLSRNILNSVDELDDKFKFGTISEKDYYEYKKSVLNNIIEINFDNFTEERTPSYKSELDALEANYSAKTTFATAATSGQLQDLKDLISDLRTKAYDKVHFKVLQETFPKVMSDELFSKLNVKAIYQKVTEKDNGFAATYYVLETPFGPIEVMLQSGKRYHEAKVGSAAHSSLSRKSLKIRDFFELANPDTATKPLDYYLDILDGKTSSEEDPKETYALDVINDAKQHVKFKDMYIDEEISTPIDEVIFRRASQASPAMYMCDSAHMMTKPKGYPTAAVAKLDLITAYSEILNKKGTLTYLGELVIDRLQSYLEQFPEYDNSDFKRIGYSNVEKYIAEKFPNITVNKQIDKEDKENEK